MNRGVAGTYLLDESLKCKRKHRDASNRGETSTLEQVVAQVQQEVFTLKVLVADQTGLAEAVRAIKRQSKLKKTLRQALVARKNSLAHRGFSTVVEENGGIFRWRDQGV